MGAIYHVIAIVSVITVVVISYKILSSNTSPTMIPTYAPTMIPTNAPTYAPTMIPTMIPTNGPTMIPTNGPTMIPTYAPTMIPTNGPTMIPTYAPTTGPVPKSRSIVPTNVSPTIAPTVFPTMAPTADITGYWYLNYFYPNTGVRKKYGIVKGTAEPVKDGSWWMRQWGLSLADGTIVARIYNSSYNEKESYFYSDGNTNDPGQTITWVKTSTPFIYMNGAPYIGDDFMMKRVYQNENKDWVAYENGAVVVKSDGSIVI